MDLPGISSLEVHRSLPSTNERAKEWIREGVRPVAMVVAGEQTRGRGRGGSRWVSRAGSGLYVSAVVEGGDPALDRLVPLRTGLALAARLDAMPGRSNREPIRLKWPNDLFYQGGKVGGILCESLAGRVVVGVGLNCSVPEVDAPYPASALEGTEPESLLPLVAEAILESTGCGESGLTTSEIAVWRSRDLLLGSEVVALGGVRGRVQGIDPRGRLLVAEPGGRIRAMMSGSVRPLEQYSS